MFSYFHKYLLSHLHFTQSTTAIQYTLSCTSNSQCSPFGAASCPAQIPRRCTCDEYAQYDELRQLCVYKQGLGEYCDSNEACSTLVNAVCLDKYCACKENFFERNNTCIPGGLTLKFKFKTYIS